MTKEKGPSWTKEEDKILIEDWINGFSAAQIAKKLNKIFKKDRSRSAVIGRIHRLDFIKQRKISVPQKIKEIKKVKPSKPALPYKELKIIKEESLSDYFHNNEIPRTSANPITLLDPWPSNVCRFPIFGNEIPCDKPLFCGKPVVRGCYCKECYEITHIVSRKEIQEIIKEVAA